MSSVDVGQWYRTLVTFCDPDVCDCTWITDDYKWLVNGEKQIHNSKAFSLKVRFNFAIVIIDDFNEHVKTFYQLLYVRKNSSNLRKFTFRVIKTTSI